jgi:hypothetical protein
MLDPPVMRDIILSFSIFMHNAMAQMQDMYATLHCAEIRASWGGPWES